MQTIIDLLIKENALNENNLKRFIDKYGEEKLTIPNLIKVRLVNQEAMEVILLNELRIQVLTIADLEGIQGISTAALLNRQAKEANIEYIDIRNVEIDYKLLKRLPLKQLLKHKVLPLFIEDEKVTVAFSNPNDFEAKGAIERFFHGKIMVVALSRVEMIEEILGQLHTEEKVEEFTEDIKQDLEQGGNENIDEKASPAVVQLIDLIL